MHVLEAEVCVQSPSVELGEGSIWDARSGRLLWLDIPNARLFRLNVATGENEEHDLSAHSRAVSSVVPLAAKCEASGDVVGLTLREGFAVYNLRTRDLRVLPRNPAVAECERFNDGKVDPKGRYWAGTITRNDASDIVPEGALYRRNLDGSIDIVLTSVSISNGIAWTDDAKIMYYTDTPQARVDAFDYDVESGEISNRRPCIEGFEFAKTGFPDGCAMDAEGMLWVARFNGGCAGRYNPKTGELLAEARVPKEAGMQVTSVAFGGEDFGDLFLTTAHEGMDAAAAEKAGVPLAGCLFRVPRAKLAEIGAPPGQPPNGLILDI